MNTTLTLQTHMPYINVAVHLKKGYKKMKKPFNPNDFDTNLSVEDVAKRFEQLSSLDFTKVSLANEIIKLNYEVISKDYEDLKYSDIKDYYHIEVDTIV